MQVEDKDAVFSALEDAYSDARKSRLDGLTIEYESWWFNLRASNTEPVMRLNLEANDLATEEEKKKEILEVIQEADHSMKVMQ